MWREGVLPFSDEVGLRRSVDSLFVGSGEIINLYEFHDVTVTSATGIDWGTREITYTLTA